MIILTEGGAGTEEQGEAAMIEQEWMKFASTGSIQDYLSYKGCQESEGLYGEAASSLLTGGNGVGRSVTGYGANHSADRHGTVSSPGGGI